MYINNLETRMGRDGCLEVSLPGFLKNTGRISPWSRGFETYEVGHNIALDRPLWGLEFFPPQDANPTESETQGFFADIPDDIRRQVQQFRFGQCALLRWLARYPAARDLCSSNPKLLWLMAAAIYDSDFDECRVPALLSQKQAVILSQIVKPGSASMLRILGKLKTGIGDLKEARCIIRALKVPHIRKIITHLESIPTSLLQAIYDNPGLAHPSMIRFLADQFESHDCNPAMLSRKISDTLADIRRMAEVLEIDNPEQAIARCRSVEKLNRLRDRWVDQVNRDHGLWLSAGQHEWPANQEPPEWFGLSKEELEQYMQADCAFPEPPLPDSKEIRAIRSVHELIGEAWIQRNCVATSVPANMNGDIHIYKVLSPHRATLELKKTNGGWETGQLKLSRNRPPGSEVEEVVRKWHEGNR